MKRNVFYVLVITGLFALSSCRQSEEEKLAEKKETLKELKQAVSKLEAELALAGYKPEDALLENAKVVTTIHPEKRDFRTFLEASGKVTSKTNLMVSSELGGTIMYLNVKEGTSVKQGQVIGQVDKSILESSIDELETSMILAQQAYDRQKNLWDQKIGSEFQYLQAKNNLESLQKRMETLKTQRNKANIIAPITGVIDKVFHNAGEMVSPGLPVVQVVNLGTIEVEAEISESYLSKVKKGDPVQIFFPSIDYTRQTVISAISQVVNPANRTFKIQSVLSNMDGMIKPNMLAIMKLTEYTGADKVVVPTKLIQEDMDGKFINIVGDSNMVEKRYLKTGHSSNGNSEIEEGLDGGESLIDLGFRLVSNGDKVRIKK